MVKRIVHSIELKLTDQEAELLISFEESPGLEVLAARLNRDPTVISKQLKRIASKIPVLDKVGGRWVLSEQGRKFNQLTRDYSLGQQAVLGERPLLRVGTNREFGSRVIARDGGRFQKHFSPAVISLQVYERTSSPG